MVFATEKTENNIYGNKNFNYSSKFMLKMIFGNENHLSLIAVLTIYELILGGAGRLVSLGSFLTIRYILFFIGLLYFAFIIYLNGFKIQSNLFYNPVLLFFIFMAIAVMTAMLNKTPIKDIFDTSKSYLYLLMIFPFSVYIRNIVQVNKAISIFVFASTIVAIISVGIFTLLLIVPSYFTPINLLLMKYEYGHLAMVSGITRVFLKTGCYMAIAFVIELYRYININEKKTIFPLVRMGLQLFGVFTTLTMGIWIALTIGIFICLLTSKGIRKVIILIVSVLIASLLFLKFGEYMMLIITSRFNSNDPSLVIKSNQFMKIIQVWSENMLFGKGMGVTIIFDSGIEVREMIKFELFWLELLVYTGILGFLSYIYILAKTFYFGIKNIQKNTYFDSIQNKGLLAGLFMMCIISSVNPFMNNPIGLGYFIFVMSIINVYYKKSINEAGKVQ